MTAKMSVRWWNHKNTIYKTISTLYHTKHFYDVILLCDDVEVKAHKFVLAMCSQYFENKLYEQCAVNKLELPQEVHLKELLFLLEYFYCGEVIIKEKEVDSLIAVSNVLKVRGIAIPFDTDDDTEEVVTEEKHCTTLKKRKHTDDDQMAEFYNTDISPSHLQIIDTDEDELDDDSSCFEEIDENNLEIKDEELNEVKDKLVLLANTAVDFIGSNSNITNLVDQEEVQLKFTAPHKPGVYTYQVCLRSDSYLGVDVSKDIKLDVKEAREIPVEHPQWEECETDEEEEEEDGHADNQDGDESEFTTDEEVTDDSDE